MGTAETEKFLNSPDEKRPEPQVVVHSAMAYATQTGADLSITLHSDVSLTIPDDAPKRTKSQTRFIAKRLRETSVEGHRGRPQVPLPR